MGKKKFETNCAVCHGYAGYGDGLVSQRAANLAQGYWLQPTSMHEERIQKQTVGRIYYTVTNGKGKMAGLRLLIDTAGNDGLWCSTFGRCSEVRTPRLKMFQNRDVQS